VSKMLIYFVEHLRSVLSTFGHTSFTFGYPRALSISGEELVILLGRR
jgi:hypothetical protein